MTSNFRSGDDAVSHFSGYVEEFQALYRERPDFRERLDLWRELLQRHLRPGQRAIDLGCGTGVFSFYMAGQGAVVTGVDGASGMIAHCEAQQREHGISNIRFVHATLPHVDEHVLGKADLVISSSVLEYVDDLDAAFALCARVLTPGGTLIVSLPTRWCINRLYERLKFRLTGEPNIYRHIRHFLTARALRTRVARHGLSVNHVRYYTHHTRLARLTRRLRLPLPLTEDLFVAVLRKEG